MDKDFLIDINEVYEITGGNEDLFRQMVDLFVELSPAQLKKIKSSFSHGDFPGLREAAHDVKSSASSLGAKPLYNAALELEMGAKKNLAPETLEPLIDRVEKVIEQTIDFFDNFQWPEWENSAR